MQPRIAFVAKQHAGKTTAATYLTINHGFQRIALADAVKDDVTAMLNYILRFVLDRDEEVTRADIEHNKAVFRPILQWYGTEFWRQYMGEEDHWIRRFQAAVDATKGPIVCDDVRFPNEVAALKKMGFYVVRIARNEDERRQSVWTAHVRQHIAKGRDVTEMLTNHERVQVTESVERAMAHPSEALVDSLAVDWVVRNNHHGLNHLYDQLDGVVSIVRQNRCLTGVGR